MPYFSPAHARTREAGYYPLHELSAVGPAAGLGTRRTPYFSPAHARTREAGYYPLHELSAVGPAAGLAARF